jgi:hypothetical protein
MSATMIASEAKAVPPVSTIQEIPLEKIRQSMRLTSRIRVWSLFG